MKKIIVSLSIIGVVAAIAIGATVAYFNDVETSTGNIFTAGTLDLKVDHVRQTYNDVDCKTCSVEIKSDTSNMVVGTVGGNDPGPFPHNAVLVGSNSGGWIHSAWTAQIGCNPRDAGCPVKWIWATDPTLQGDTTSTVIYTFRKTFEWWGPISGVTLNLGVGADNSYEVWLNGVKVAGDNTEKNYNAAGQDTYTDGPVLANIQQGQNTIEFKVKNWALASGTPKTNPGGLLYKLVIDGQCDSDYFKTHCTLWGEKDLAPGDYFWQFTDVKPGDRGTNIISMHVFDNDAFGCLLVTNPVDNENGVVDSEVGDLGEPGELSQFLSAVLWSDANKNKQYDAGETILYEPAVLKDMKNMNDLPLTATSTAYIGLAWCLGTQNVDQNAGIISCSGSGNQDISQTDSFLASLTAYAEQQRNNAGFDCASVILP